MSKQRGLGLCALVPSAGSLIVVAFSKHLDVSEDVGKTKSQGKRWGKKTLS